MIRSMTGYGRGEYTENNITFSVEIRSVNHRYSDYSIRIPRLYSSFEEKVRAYITSKINRGKVDIYVNYDLFQQDVQIKIDQNLASAYIDSLHALRNQYDIKDDVSLALLARFPDILKPERIEQDEEQIWIILKNALEQATEMLIQMRHREGTRLFDDIMLKLGDVEKTLSIIEGCGHNYIQEYKMKLHDRIKDLTKDVVLDENRLMMEVAIFADKCCIDEELVRMKSHIKEFRSTIENSNSVGKRLDFIVQEMNREVNTIGSKAVDLNIINSVISIKSDIEKIREQIQNVE